jgi:hypothetical protein
MNLEEFLDTDQFEPTPAPAPKKRGRPAATKPKPAAKPRWQVKQYTADELIGHLREVACILEPGCAGNIAHQLKIAAELLELIENKKA